MTSDPSPGAGPAGRLWTDPRETEEHTALARAQAGRAARCPRRRRTRRRRPDEPRRRRARRAPPPAPARHPRRHASSPRCSSAPACSARACSAATTPSRSPPRCRSSPAPRPPTQRSRSIRAIYAAREGQRRAGARARRSTSAGSGTGFVIDKGGVIVTNAHVVKDAQQVQVRLERQRRLRRRRGRRDRRLLRPRRAARRLVGRGQAAPAAARRLRQGPRRRPDARDRLSARPQPQRVGVGGHRLRPRPLDRRGQQLLDRQGHPDRRRDQPRQLRRAAARLRRPRDRRQHGDPHRRRRRQRRRSASRCRRTRCARSCRGWSAAARCERAYLGVQTRESQTGPGAYVAERHARRAGGGRAACRSATSIVGVGGEPVTIPEDISIAIDDRKPGERVEIEVERAGARKTLQRDARDAPRDARPARRRTPSMPVATP